MTLSPASSASTINQVRKITKDPILLSETAVGPSADRSAKIPDLFRGLAKYRTLGLVWFDMPSDMGSSTRTGASKATSRPKMLSVTACPAESGQSH